MTKMLRLLIRMNERINQSLRFGTYSLTSLHYFCPHCHTSTGFGATTTWLGCLHWFPQPGDTGFPPGTSTLHHAATPPLHHRSLHPLPIHVGGGKVVPPQAGGGTQEATTTRGLHY